MSDNNELNINVLNGDKEPIIYYEDGQRVLEVDSIVLCYGKDRYSLRIINGEISINKMEDKK